ncbi:extracellular solute-binding protein [Chelativorans sp. YIM 93263]|uniref:extracellular solute-binding protein n=1 Tax=Chelativorans sp. YIM 93263 TaxID=2906648 RepID=UPI0023798891|nr:extracellular solute-binding protein [Chelativorans sp. YIM 93263]
MRALHGFSCRTGVLIGGFAAMLAATTAGAQDEQEWRTASSLIDSEAETEVFERYAYVNPDAPKGGTLNSTAPGTFDSFNPFVVRGTPAAGLTSFGGLLWETLMQQSPEEPGTSHPLVAEAFKYPEDYSSATYRINPEARWHDGTPITAEDVVWSFDTLKEVSPQHSQYFANVEEAVAVSEREVHFRFDQAGNRELPHIMGDLPVLPKHWWTGTNAEGDQRDIAAPTLEPPLGSGPYRIASFEPGSEIVWERVEDYWAADLPVNIGRYNYDRRRYSYFVDDNAAFLAFTKGGIEDIRRELSSRRWSQDYNFPAVEAGDVIKREFTAGSIHAMQAFVFNMRKPHFDDPRVREALTLAYNFEQQNRTHFFGLNERFGSYFENSELAATGFPEGQELEILEEFRDELPPELFTEEFELPVFDTPQSEREYLREAVRLFKEAGWVIRDGRMVNEETGEQFRIEFLGSSPTSEVIAGGLIANLRRIGIDATLRIVDTSQYIQRVQQFDFDAVTSRFAQSNSPGNEQRDYWSSEAAEIPGSRNLAGIQDPVVDALVNKIIYAEDREELVALTRALDRVLLWNYFMIPQYYQPTLRYAYWNKFGIPDEQPAYAGVDIESWWVRPEREEEIEEEYGEDEN